MSSQCCETILSLLQKSLIRVTEPKADLQREVLNMTAPILELEIEKYQDQYNQIVLEKAELEKKLNDHMTQ